MAPPSASGIAQRPSLALPANSVLRKIKYSNVPDNVREADDDDAALLSAYVAQILPKHDPNPVRLSRCLYTVTPDENFLITPSKAHDRVLLFSACSGHGFKYAPVFGELAEEWLRGEPSRELEAFGLAKRGDVNRLGAAKS